MSKIKVFPNGYATLEKLFPSGYYLVQCYKGTELHDKIRCDDYRMATDTNFILGDKALGEVSADEKMLYNFYGIIPFEKQ